MMPASRKLYQIPRFDSVTTLWYEFQKRRVVLID